MAKKNCLVGLGYQMFNTVSTGSVNFVQNQNANALLNDLKNHPHVYVLACCMDRQMKAEDAWMIPFKVKGLLKNSFSMNTLLTKSQNDYEQLFIANNLHRFPKIMAEVFYKAVQRIHNEYGDDASRIWSEKPSSASVVYQFLQFEGVGIKIATMATNILARDFKIPFSDYYSIDVSPDTHIKRVMRRMGLVPAGADNDRIIYKARELNPVYPGIIDLPLWDIGRNYCKAKKRDCLNCPVRQYCKKLP